MFEFFAHLGIGFFVGILLGLIFMFGESVFEAVCSWAVEKKAESIDIASIGVLEPVEDVDTSGSDDFEEREKAWQMINNWLNDARSRACAIDISYEVYKVIPYKTLVKTLRNAGYKPRDTMGDRFLKSDYDMRNYLRITWR